MEDVWKIMVQPSELFSLMPSLVFPVVNPVLNLAFSWFDLPKIWMITKAKLLASNSLDLKSELNPWEKSTFFFHLHSSLRNSIDANGKKGWFYLRILIGVNWILVIWLVHYWYLWRYSDGKILPFYFKIFFSVLKAKSFQMCNLKHFLFFLFAFNGFWLPSDIYSMDL